MARAVTKVILDSYVGKGIGEICGNKFDSPQQNAFYHFGQCLKADNMSLIPMAFGVLSAFFSFRFPHST